MYARSAFCPLYESSFHVSLTRCCRRTQVMRDAETQRELDLSAKLALDLQVWHPIRRLRTVPNASLLVLAQSRRRGHMLACGSCPLFHATT